MSRLLTDIQYNCDISDARDHGIYSMCTMVLKLRNLYKWEHGLAPWEEPEPAKLLDWIDTKENFWEKMAHEQFIQLTLGDRQFGIEDTDEMNQMLYAENLFYGAGAGRSLKAVFFLAEIKDRVEIEGYHAVILGREHAREMASPFAMVQDNIIVIRRESLRFFLWDQIQELRSTCRLSLKHALEHYGMMKNDSLDQQQCRDQLDQMVDNELDLFLYHEVGELCENIFDSQALRQMVAQYPSSIVEFFCRALKDVLADTHPQGVVAHIIGNKRDSSLSLYTTLLDGLRKSLCPELAYAGQEYFATGSWQMVEDARMQCRSRAMQLAGEIKSCYEASVEESAEAFISRFAHHFVEPLGIEQPRP